MDDGACFYGLFRCYRDLYNCIFQFVFSFCIYRNRGVLSAHLSDQFEVFLIPLLYSMFIYLNGICLHVINYGVMSTLIFITCIHVIPIRDDL